MTRVDFYHLLTSPLEVALSGLLEKALERDMRAVVMTVSRERATTPRQCPVDLQE